MNTFELIILLAGVFTSMIDNLIQFCKQKIQFRLILACFLFIIISTISISWAIERNGVNEIKGAIVNILSDKTFFTKIKSETEIEEHLLLYLQYDKNRYNIALIEMLRDNELIIETEQVSSAKLNRNCNLKYFFLSRQFVENNH